MKYSSTHRLMNTVLFGILTAGFVTLVVFFTFFWAPHSVESHYLTSVDFIQNGKTFAFNANLSALFIALSIVSGAGLFFSIKSLINANNDELVVDSFLCYVAIGYVAAIFFVLNAIWLYDLIGSGEPTFWIILCVLGAIAALIAANVPMMKLLEDDKTNRLSAIVSGSFFSVSAGTFVTVLVSLLVVLTKGASYSHGWDTTYLVVFTIASLVAAVLAGTATLLYKKNNKVKVANYCTYGSLIGFAAIPMFSGVYELVLEDSLKSGSKMSLVTDGAGYAGTTYCVMAIITGSLLVIAAIALFIANSVAEKKAA